MRAAWSANRPESETSILERLTTQVRRSQQFSVAVHRRSPGWVKVAQPVRNQHKKAWVLDLRLSTLGTSRIGDAGLGSELARTTADVVSFPTRVEEIDREHAGIEGLNEYQKGYG